MNHVQGMQVSTASLALSVCLPAMFIIRNLLGLPKLACPSLFLLLSVRRKDTIRREETEEADLGIKDVESISSPSESMGSWKSGRHWE